MVVFLLILLVLIILGFAVKICYEYERGFVFRLGRLVLPPKGPGIWLIIPFVDRWVKIKLKSEAGLWTAERFLEEAKTQKDANPSEIDGYLRELRRSAQEAQEARRR